MGKKYIINIPDSVGRVIYTDVDPINGETYIASYSVEDLTPYTAPDLEQVRKEAYDKGQKDLRESCVPKDEEAYGIGYNEGFQCGLDLAWEAARKIASDDAGQNHVIFGQHFANVIFNTFTASDAIEKIQKYEQEVTSKRV